MHRPINLRSIWFPLLVVLIAGFWLVNAGNQHTARHHFDVKHVAVADANAWVQAGALVIDVRGKDQFDYRHIPGAILIPLAVLRAGIPASIAAAKDKPVVVYCNEGLVHGPEGADLLNKAGFTNVVNIQSGIEGWVRAGLPVQKG